MFLGEERQEPGSSEVGVRQNLNEEPLDAEQEPAVLHAGMSVSQRGFQSVTCAKCDSSRARLLNDSRDDDRTASST